MVAFLWGIYARKANLVLNPIAVQHRDGVAVSHTHDLASDVLCPACVWHRHGCEECENEDVKCFANSHR